MLLAVGLGLKFGRTDTLLNDEKGLRFLLLSFYLMWVCMHDMIPPKVVPLFLGVYAAWFFFGRKRNSGSLCGGGHLGVVCIISFPVVVPVTHGVANGISEGICVWHSGCRLMSGWDEVRLGDGFV